jgi:hypothetical protein
MCATARPADVYASFTAHIEGRKRGWGGGDDQPGLSSDTDRFKTRACTDILRKRPCRQTEAQIQKQQKQQTVRRDLEKSRNALQKKNVSYKHIQTLDS